jgi:hypothetical protein
VATFLKFPLPRLRGAPGLASNYYYTVAIYNTFIKLPAKCRTGGIKMIHILEAFDEAPEGMVSGVISNMSKSGPLQEDLSIVRQRGEEICSIPFNAVYGVEAASPAFERLMRFTDKEQKNYPCRLTPAEYGPIVACFNDDISAADMIGKLAAFNENIPVEMAYQIELIENKLKSVDKDAKAKIEKKIASGKISAYSYVAEFEKEKERVTDRLEARREDCVYKAQIQPGYALDFLTKCHGGLAKAYANGKDIWLF